MRTPPPLLTPRSDDSQPNSGSALSSRDSASEVQERALGKGVLATAGILAAGIIVSLLAGVPSMALLLGILLLGLLLGALTTYMGVRMGEGAGLVVKSFIQPSGDSTPYEQTFSYQEAMIMRGEIDEALESFEAIIAEQPSLVSARLQAAEHYARGNRNPARAAELFREVRAIPGVPVRDAIYSSSRLVDLYDGPLADPGRALVELRRIIELYPGSALATHARTALPALKARLEQEPKG